MKIVILDGFTENPGDLSWDGLRACGDLTVYDRTPADLTAQRMQGAEAVFTNKTIISAEIMEKCPALKFIGVLATGVNIVDIKAASDRGIVVSNVPAYGTASVAQFTMALLLELCHHAGDHSQAVKNGEWGSCPDFCFWKYPLTELAEKTMGIIGFGNVGRTVARMALAFGMKVLAIRGGLAGSTVMDAKVPMMLDGNDKPGFKIDLHIKDLKNALETGHGVGMGLPLTAQVMEKMQQVAADGFGGKDHCALVKYYEKMTGESIRR